MPTYALSILLLKEAIHSPSDALRNSGALNNQALAGAEENGMLYWKASFQKPPRWISLFVGAVGDAMTDVTSGNAAAVLFLKVEDRWFALSFGFGRNLLRPGSYEENFGLRVVLNSVLAEKLRSIDAQSLEAVPLSRRSQSGRAAELGAFGVDVERDVLYAASGEPEDKSLGKQIAGKDSVRVSVPIALDGIPALLSRLLVASKAETYKTRGFGWVDNLAEVRDDTLKKQLDAELEAKIKAGDLSKTWLAPPEIIDWHDVAGFKYQRPKQGDLEDEISWDAYLAFLEETDEEPTIETFKKHSVLCMSASSGEVIVDWTVLRCIYAELDHGAETYLLNNGRWYRVATDFLTGVNQDVDNIAISALALPDYHDDDEGAYNIRAAREDAENLALMDKRLIAYGGGRSEIEFCDLYSKDHKLVHVKRYGGSSVLSHLFAQGVVSAELLLRSVDFRKKLNEKLPDSHRLQNPDDRPVPRDFEVVYAVAAKSTEEKPALPLFSRITLRNASERLQALDIPVSLAFIKIADAQATDGGEDGHE